MLEGTTPVPNTVFDELMPTLSPSELKVLLVVLRKTFGWEDKTSPTGRKQRDWISNSQLEKHTGLSAKSIQHAKASLSAKGLLEQNEEGLPNGGRKVFLSFSGYSPIVSEKRVPSTKESWTKEKTESFSKEQIEKFKQELKEAGSFSSLMIQKEATIEKEGRRTLVRHEDVDAYRAKHCVGYIDKIGISLDSTIPYSYWHRLYGEIVKGTTY